MSTMSDDPETCAWRVRHRAVSMLSGAAREVREMRYGRGAR